MKKYLILLAGIAICISLVGCQKNIDNSSNNVNDIAINNSQQQNNSNDNLNNELDEILNEGTNNNYSEISENEKNNILDNSFTKDSYFSQEEMKQFETTQVISLEENPTTGYTWHYRFGEDGIAVVEDDEFVANNTEGLVGAGGIHTYRLSGVKPGETGIKFEYRRALEDKEPIKIISYEITVDENNQIAITEENIY